MIWCPSNVALGAWVSGNYKPLSDYLYELLPKISDIIAFRDYQSDVLLRTLKSGNVTLMICINKSAEARTIALNGLSSSSGTPYPIYASEGCSVMDGELTMAPEGVLVVKW